MGHRVWSVCVLCPQVRRHAQSLAAVSSPADRGDTVDLRLDAQLLDVTVEALGGARAAAALVHDVRRLGEYGLSLVEARLEPGDVVKLRRVGGEERGLMHRHPWLVCEGDILLTDGQLRQRLVEAGVTPEFTWGPEGASLVCDKTTTVKVKDNRVVVEGELSETFFKVRKVLYSRFIML